MVLRPTLDVVDGGSPGCASHHQGWGGEGVVLPAQIEKLDEVVNAQLTETLLVKVLRVRVGDYPSEVQL